jgi:hypothetical protein
MHVVSTAILVASTVHASGDGDANQAISVRRAISKPTRRDKPAFSIALAAACHVEVDEMGGPYWLSTSLF